MALALVLLRLALLQDKLIKRGLRFDFFPLGGFIVEFSEDYTLRTLVDCHSLYEDASPVLHEFGIRKQESFTLAYRLLPILLRKHHISLRLSLVICLGIGCYFCLALELLFEHAVLMLVEIELIDAL